MLLFNVIDRKSFYDLLYLKTSYVIVQQLFQAGRRDFATNLKTSYVIVQPNMTCCLISGMRNLKTSYVIVQQALF